MLSTLLDCVLPTSSLKIHQSSWLVFIKQRGAANWLYAQLKVKEIKEAWETKKLGFVRILNGRKIVFGKLLKIVSCVRRILFSEDFWPGLLERFGFVDGGWTRAESICLFCCCLFHCEYSGLAQSFECRFLQYQVRMHRRIESLDESVSEALAALWQGG